MSSSSAAFQIIFGANTSELDRALKSTEKRLRQTSRKLNSIGRGLTNAVTLPLIGIGAAALKSAVDMEKLETSFISLTGGAKQAADMVKQLQEFSASTPFQIEGIASAARQLIATGTGLDEVNDTLRFLGDIAAASGSEINDIAAIFAKVKAKGKVELESINQLAERGIPIFEKLSEATGLASSELGAGAVSVQQFEAVLRAMAAEGGLAHNAMLNLSETAGGKLSTAFDVLKEAGAEIGKELLPVIKKLLDKVIDLAKAFTNLDSSAQKSILQFSALAASIGPITRVSGFLVGNVSKLVPAMRTLGGLISVAFGSKTLIGLGSYTGGLRTIVALKTTLNNLAAKTPVLMAAAFAIAGISSFIGKVQKAKAQVKEFNDIQYNAKAIFKSRAKFFEDENKRLGYQAKALNSSNASAADYNKTLESLTEENVRFALSVREGTVPLSQTIGFVKLSADALKILEDKMKDVVSFGGDKLPAALEVLRDRLKDLAAEALERESLTGAEEEIVEVTELAKLLLRVADQKARIAATDLFTPDEIAKQEALASAMRSAAISAEILGSHDLAQQYDAEADAAENLANKLSKANAERLKQIELVNQYGDNVNGLLSALTNYGATVQENQAIETEAKQTAEEFATNLVNSAVSIGGAIAQVNADLREQQKELQDQYAEGTITQEEYVKKQRELQQQAQADRHREIAMFLLQIMAKVTAQAIANAYQSAAATGPAAVFTGPALAAAAVAGMSAMMPKFKRGGMVTGETLAVLGDNQSGKEAVIPFERMGEFLGKFGGGGGTQHITVSGRLSGSDILLSAERSKRSVQRVTGVTF